MATRFTLVTAVLLTLLLVYKVSANLQLLADVGIDNSNDEDVHSVYINGYYVLLHVKIKDTTTTDSLYRCSFSVLQLVNGSTIKLLESFTPSVIRVNSVNKYITINLAESQPTSPNQIANVDICSSVACYGWAIDITQAVFRVSPLDLCHSGINKSTDELMSLDSRKGNRGFVITRVVASKTQTRGYICLADGGRKSLQLECSDNSGPFSDILSVELILTADKFNAFVLASRGELTEKTTVLCSFSATLRDLPSTDDTIRAQDSRLEFADSPVTLAVTVTEAGNDHIAFVSTPAGTISKVKVYFTNHSTSVLF